MKGRQATPRFDHGPRDPVEPVSITSYFFISLVLGPLNSLLWYVPSSRYIWSSAPTLFLQEQIEDIIIKQRNTRSRDPVEKVYIKQRNTCRCSGWATSACHCTGVGQTIHEREQDLDEDLAARDHHLAGGKEQRGALRRAEHSHQRYCSNNQQQTENRSLLAKIENERDWASTREGHAFCAVSGWRGGELRRRLPLAC